MSRNASRSAVDPSPNVIRPATSTTLTSPTCRLVNFTLTEHASWLKSLILFGHHVLDQSYFHPAGLQAADPEIVHERPDQKNAAARIAEQVLRCQRIRHAFHVEPLALIDDPH